MVNTLRVYIFGILTSPRLDHHYLQGNHTSGLRSPLVGVDVVDIVANAGVDTSETSLGASLTPRDKSKENLGAGIDDGSTAVTVARILTSLRETGAEHVVGDDASSSILLLACSPSDDGNGNLPQRRGQGLTALASETPILLRVSIVPLYTR